MTNFRHHLLLRLRRKPLALTFWLCYTILSAIMFLTEPDGHQDLDDAHEAHIDGGALVAGVAGLVAGVATAPAVVTGATLVGAAALTYAGGHYVITLIN